jgi:hypothetical protein
VTPKRGDRAAPPPTGTEFDVRFANSSAADGWEHLTRHAAANLRKAYEVIRADPRHSQSLERHHRLRGALASGIFKGERHERWQYEVTGGGRIWYLIDDARRTAWITYAGTGHLSETD